METNYLVVVGVDGSEGSRQALRWAARKAAAHAGMMYVVAAWRWDHPATRAGGPATRPGNPKLQAEAMLEREIADLAPTVPIAYQIVEGEAAEVLCAAARDADLLVLGSSAAGQLPRPVLGATARECARTARSPVVVITGPYDTWRPARQSTPNKRVGLGPVRQPKPQTTRLRR